MLQRQIVLRLQRLVLAVPSLSVVCVSFALAPSLWSGYSPFLGAIAFGIGLLVVLSVVPVLVFRFYNPPASAFMLQTRARLRRRDPAHAELAYRWVDLSHIAPQMCLAVIVAEDFTFPIHYGIVLDSVTAAIEANQGIENRDYWRGGSTITQQMVKNLFLWSARSFLRKAIELHLTLLVELLWSKRRILEVYLNIAQFGENIFGVEAASRAYWNKPASALSAQESSLLASALPNPMLYPVRQPSPRMRYRQVMISSAINKISPQYMGYMKKIGLYG